MQPKLRLLLMTLSVILFSFVTTLVFGQATINTDKDDYPPGATVVITGSGFQAGETVTLQVLHLGDGDNDVSGAHTPWEVVADGAGKIDATWIVPLDEDELGATLKLTADGKGSGLHAETTFTDAVTPYYYDGSGSLADVNNWGTNTNGTGTHPSNFIGNNQSFNIRNVSSVTLDANWVVSGANSSVIVGDGSIACNLTIPTGFILTGKVDLSASGTLVVQNATIPTLGVLSNGSTVDYASSGNQTITAATYSNLKTSGGGTKSMSSGIVVSNAFTIGAGTTVDALGFTTTISGGATLSINGTLDFTSSTGIFRSGTAGTSTLQMGSTGLIRTVDDNGLGPVANASFQTQTGGAWDMASISIAGTVEYYRNATSGQTVTDRDYNNITFTGSSQSKNWSLTASRTISGTFTNNGVVGVNGLFSIFLKGNWIWTGGGSTPNKVIFDGSATQYINAPILAEVVINNSVGIVLQSNFIVATNLTLTNGIIDGNTNNKTISLVSVATITGGSSSSYINGKLALTYSTTGSKTFPIGKGGNYRPLTLNYTNLVGGTSTVTAEQFESGFGGTFSSGNQQLGTRYWTVTQSGSSIFTYDITLDGSDYTPTGAVKILKYNSPSTNTLMSTTKVLSKYTASGLTTFSDFALGQTTNTAPLASTPQAETTNEDVAKTITPSVTDAENDPLTFEIVSSPTHGSVVINGDGTFTYTPSSDYNGPDAFTYKAKDDKNEYSNVATINMTIASVNDAPSGANKTVTTDEDVDYTFTTSDFGFTDVDGNSLFAVKLTSLPAAGNLTVNGSNVTVAGTSIAVADITAGNLKFHTVSNANGSGYASFTFQVQDNGGTANSGVDLDPSAKTMTIDVTAVNDAPTLSNVAKASEKEDIPVSFTATNFSNQFADIDGNSLTKIKITSLATHGTLQLSGVAVIVDQEIAVDNIGNLSFVPDANYNGPVSFGWNGSDGTAYATSAALVNITLASVNDAPAGGNNIVTTLEDNDYIFTPSDFGFTDPNDNPANGFAAVKLASLPSTGSLTLNGSVISSTVTPISYTDINAGNFKFHPALNGDGINYASFTFQVKDDGGTTNDGVDLDPSANSMQINITPVSDAPAGTNGSVNATEDQDYVFTLANFGFTDPNDNPAHNFNAVTITTLPLNGTLTLSGSNVLAGTSVSATDISSGNLKFRAANNANGNNYTSFTFQVEDDGSTDNGGANLDPTANTITINVAAVNDAPTVANAIDDVTVDEDASNTVIDLSSTFADVDGDNLTITVYNNSNSALVTASYNAGTKELTLHYNTDKHGTATITIRASDGNLTTDDQFLVTVRSVNDAPAGANKTVNINEDHSYTFSASDFGFTDPKDDDPVNSLLAVKITTLPANGVLKLSGTDVATGDFIPAANIASLVFTPATNANGTPYTSFTFQVQDNGGTANSGVDTDPSPKTVTINVAAVNDAPVFVKGADQTILEDAGPQSVTGWATGIDDGDAEETQAVSFEITGNTNTALFSSLPAIDAYGKLTYTPATNANGSATITIRITDDGGTALGGSNASATQTFLITVTPVNDAPSFTKGDDQTVNEDAGLQTVNPWATGLSKGGGADEASQTLSFEITNNSNGALFSALPSVSSTGVLTYTPAANKHGVATITIRIKDNGGTDNSGVDASATQTFTIAVRSVNDAPTGEDKLITILEDNNYTFSLADFGFADGNDDPANNFSAVKITSLPSSTSGTLKNNGVGVIAGSLVSVADITGGNLIFFPAANGNGASFASFTFKVQDDGGTDNSGVDLDPAANTITFNVTPVNDAPVFTKGADVTVNEDAGAKTIAAWATGISDGDVEATQILTFDVSNDNNPLFSVQPSIDPATGTLTFTPFPNANGTALVTVRLKDNGGTDNGGIDQSAAQTFTITVTAVNDVPVFTKGANQTKLEDAGAIAVNGWATDISAGTSDESAQALTFHVSNDKNALFDVQPAVDASGNLTYTLKANANGVANVTVYLTDDGGTANSGDDQSDAQSFTITVTSVNDAPAGTDKTVSINEDNSYTFASSNFGFTDPNDAPANSLLAVKITTLPANGTLKLGSATVAEGDLIPVASIGTLVFTPAANANGSPYTSFTFQVKDDGTTANGGVDIDATPNTFTFNVLEVNDAPVVNSVTPLAPCVQYSDLLSVSINVTDVDNASLKAISVTGLPAGAVLTPAVGTWNGTGNWTLSGIITAAPGSYPVSVVFSDNSLTATASFTIEVKKEDARAIYTGAEFVSTSGTTSSAATITLSATIQDITAATGDPAYDANEGDIKNAVVKFVNRDAANAVIATVPIGYVNLGDKKVGTVTYDWKVDIGNVDARQYTIGIVVEGYYTRNSSDDNEVINVAKPLNDFITGGGYLILDKPEGQIKPKKGTKNNFGFNVKYNKSGTNLQGSINTIVRSENGKVYQVKGNAMTSLAITGATSTSPAKGIFNGKANIQDITDPTNTVPVDGNATLQVTMTDLSDDGKYDRIAITVWSKDGGLWLASNWSGTKTEEQCIAKGNLKVSSNSSFGTNASITSVKSSLNPSGQGQAVTFTATVATSVSSTTKPTGSITFKDYTANAILGTVSLNSTTGTAIFTTSALSVGAHEIVAYYSGDSKYIPGSGLVTQTVNLPSTITMSANPRVANNPGIAKNQKELFEAKAYPNPATSQFTIKLESSNSTGAISIIVYGINGKVVEQRQKLTAGQTVQLGALYRPGVYILEMIQGTQHKQLKLVKIPD